MRNSYVIIIVLLIFVIAGLLIYPKIQQNKTSNSLNQSNMSEEQNLNENGQNQNPQNNPADISDIQVVDGIGIKVLREGEGAEIKNGEVAVVHYEGIFTDGQAFDSSVVRGEPFQFVLGQGMVIQGWEKGILGMKIGEVRRLVIEGDLAYGPSGVTAPDGTVVIPPNATLIFTVELLDIGQTTL